MVAAVIDVISAASPLGDATAEACPVPARIKAELRKSLQMPCKGYRFGLVLADEIEAEGLKLDRKHYKLRKTKWRKCNRDNAVKYAKSEICRTLEDVEKKLTPAPGQSVYLITINPRSANAKVGKSICEGFVESSKPDYWFRPIEPTSDGLPHFNLMILAEDDAASAIEAEALKVRRDYGFDSILHIYQIKHGAWFRPAEGLWPWALGYSAKFAYNSNTILEFRAWLKKIGERFWFRQSESKTPNGYVPCSHSANPLYPQPHPTLEKNHAAPPPSPTGFPAFVDPIHPEETSLKLRIKTLQTLIKSEIDEETLFAIKQNLKELIATKKELYPARPKEIEFGKAFSKKKNFEKLRENEQAINDARNLADAHNRGDRDFIAAAGLNPDEARPIFAEPEKRDADINNLFETINKWDGKNLKRTNIYSKQKSISDFEHWEKVASAHQVFREIKKTAENELKAIKNDYDKREDIMKGLNEELAMARKLKDKELLMYVRLNIKSLKGLIIKHDQLQFILEKMPINIQYHCHLTKQIYHITRYLNQKNWKKLSEASELFDLRQKKSKAENAQKRLDGKDNRKVMKYAGTNIPGRAITQEIIKIEDEALKLKNMKKKGG